MPPAATHSDHRPRRRPRRGFSLAEAVVASLIVGVLMVSALQTVGSAVGARRSHALMRQGDLLARPLIDEIAQCRYADPDDTPAWGLEVTEKSVSETLGSGPVNFLLVLQLRTLLISATLNSPL